MDIESLQKKERVAMLVVGIAGCGKTHFIREFVKGYKTNLSDKKIYYISPIEFDTTMDGCEEIDRISIGNLLDESDIGGKFKNSFVIIDGIDGISRTPVRERIYEILSEILTIGEQNNISIAYLCHDSSYRNFDELARKFMTITVFPRELRYNLKEILRSRFGVSEERLEDI